MTSSCGFHCVVYELFLRRAFPYRNVEFYFTYNRSYIETLRVVILLPYRGADKSLARPGRKQVTATKL